MLEVNFGILFILTVSLGKKNIMKTHFFLNIQLSIKIFLYFVCFCIGSPGMFL